MSTWNNNRFMQLEKLGESLESTVSLVFDRESKNDLVLKELSNTDLGSNSIFKQEFRRFSDVHHTNLVQLYELFTSDEQTFFTMEYVQGLNPIAFLSKVRSENPMLLGQTIQDVFLQLASGIEELHSRSLVHSDIKPENVLISSEQRVVLLDFGMAENKDPARQIVIAGTPKYMAPEQKAGQGTTAASDWYSFGLVILESLVGQELEDDDDLENLLAELGPDTNPELLDLLEGLLNQSPLQRPSYQEIVSNLGAKEVHDGSLRPADTFVGREQEIAVIQDIFGKALQQGQQLLTIVGDSGIGKTTLVEQSMSVGKLKSGILLQSRCLPNERTSFNAFDAIFEGMVDLLSESDQLTAPDHLDSLCCVFPIFSRIVFRPARDQIAPSPDSQLLKREAFLALHELIAEMTETQPVIIWMDDFQWAARDNYPILAALQAPPFNLALLLVLTHKETIDLATVIFDPDRLHQLSLGPLSTAELHNLITRIHGESSALTYANQIADESGGSPFFAKALISEIDTVGSSLSLKEILQKQIRRLPGECQEILDLIAVGHGLTLDQLQRCTVTDMVDELSLITLYQESLAKYRMVDGLRLIEPYHHQISEAVLEALLPQQKRELHSAIAEAMRSGGDYNLVRLSYHYLSARNNIRACRIALVAGKRALSQLEFSTAIEMYNIVVNNSTIAIHRIRAMHGLAKALKNVGRNHEAALTYQQIAAESSIEPQLQQSSLLSSVELFLSSGYNDEGIALAKSVLQYYNLEYPEDGHAVRTMNIELFTELGVLMNTPRATQLNQDALDKSECCYALGKCLTTTAVMYGFYFAMSSLKYALQSGDDYTICKNLAYVGGGLLSGIGGDMHQWGKSMMDEAVSIAENQSDEYLDAFICSFKGQDELLSGNWQVAREFCDSAIQGFQRNCEGVAWEQNHTIRNLMRALEELGEYGELERCATSSLQLCIEREDKYGIMSARGYLALLGLKNDDIQTSRWFLKLNAGIWHPTEYTFQDLYEARTAIFCDLYEANLQSATDRFRKHEDSLRSNSMQSVPMVRLDYNLLVGRLAMSVEDDLGSLIDTAIANLQKMVEQSSRSDCEAHMHYFSALRENSMGRRTQAVNAIEKASKIFSNEGMRHYEACSHWILGMIDSRQEEVDLAWQTFKQEHVVKPQQFMRIYAPGIISLSGSQQ